MIAKLYPKSTGKPLVWYISVLILTLGIPSCGGGGGSQGPPPPPPPTPDFRIEITPDSQSLNAGSSSSVSVSVTAIDGFSSSVAVQITGVPDGVAVSPANITLTPGTPQEVTLTAAKDVPNKTATVSFAGSSGSLTHTANLNLTVYLWTSGVPGRTGYLRTDATTEYFGWLNQHWIVYHPNTSRFFVTDPLSNRVIVIDAASRTQLAVIGVPGAFGIDDTADHAKLYVGTLIGDVYAIDPVTMSVTKRYLGSEIGPEGYFAWLALGLADGRLALLGPEGTPGLPDGSTSMAVWNPADNSITTYGRIGLVQEVPFPCGPFLINVGGFTLTVDRSKIILGSIDSDATLCEIDPLTGQGNYTTATPFSLNHILTSPDGKYIVQPSYSEGQAYAVVYDAQTLAKVTQFSILGHGTTLADFVISTDSTTLYVPTQTIIYAYSISTGQLLGWTPNINVEPTAGGLNLSPASNPYLLATDGTGVFAGPMEEGVGFMDLSVLNSGFVGTEFLNGYFNPATGPSSGSTKTQDFAYKVAGLKSIYFGSNPATDISYGSNYIYATTPAGTAGPVDVYIFAIDGGMQLLADGFSYGPTNLEVTPNMATAEGGGTGYIYGYGFGPSGASGIPSDLAVSISGSPVQVTAFDSNAYHLASPPFPLQSVAYTIPPGVGGTTVDVSVATSSGGTTARQSLTYLPAIQQFALPGSTLVQGVYDPHNDLYYFTDTNQVQVFSLTKAQWLTPISIPVPPGANQRLWGIALSPDGTKLAISDAAAGVIHILNPSNPSSVRTFTVGSQNNGYLINPCGLAVADTGNVYYAVFVLGGTGVSQFFKLDTITEAITDYHVRRPGADLNDLYLRVAISSDSSHVYFNAFGQVFGVDTATDQLFSATVNPVCCYLDYELSLSGNQTQVTATSYLYDSQLNGESFYALNDREIGNMLYVYGAKLSPDGGLLFQPSVNGIDIFDGHLGNLRARVSLPVSLSPNYDALVVDGTDNKLVAITGNDGNGIAVVDLTSVLASEPPVYDNDLFTGENRLLRLSKLQGPVLQPPKNKVDPTNMRPTHLVPHVTRSVTRVF